MRTGSKVTLSMFVTIMVLGGIGAGIYFGLFNKDKVITATPVPSATGLFNSSESKKNTVSGNEELRKASTRNDIDIDCTYRKEKYGGGEGASLINTFSFVQSDELVNNKAPESLVCLILLTEGGKPNNFFPAFTFNGVIDELTFKENKDGTLEGLYTEINALTKDELEKRQFTENDTVFSYKQLDGLDTLEFEKRKYKVYKENAKKIVSFLLNTTSFGSEMALIDEVTLQIEPDHELPGGDAHGVYSSNARGDSFTLLKSNGNANTPGTNRKTITLNVKETDKYEDLRVLNEKPLFYNMPGYEGITPDLYKVGQTFAHEYGHHVTLHNKGLDSSTFLKELDEITPDSQKWTDFKKLYEYFNNPDENFKSTIHPKELFEDSDTEKKNPITNPKYSATPTDYDYEHLNIYRKYFSKNVLSFKDDIIGDDYKDSDSKWQTRMYATLRKILTGKVNENDKPSKGSLESITLLTDVASKIEAAIKGDVLVESGYEALKEFFEGTGAHEDLYFYKNDIASILHENSVTDQPVFINYWLVPSSFGKAKDKINKEDALVIKDVFPGLTPENIEKGEGTTAETDEWNCQDEPLNHLTSSSVNYEATVFNGEMEKFNESISPSKKNETFTSFYEGLDASYLNVLAYYFSYKELSARLYGILSYDYSDNRDAIAACKFRSKTEETRTVGSVVPSSLPDGEIFHDYAMLKAFGVDVLEDNNEYKLLKALRGDGSNASDLENKSIKFQKYHDDKTDTLFYSFNSIGERFDTQYKTFDEVVEKKVEERAGWWSVYSLAQVKISKPEDAFLVTLEFDLGNRKIYRRAASYNYNNIQVVEGDKILERTYPENRKHLWEKDSPTNVVELVFFLETIKGNIFFDKTQGRFTLTYENNEFKSTEELRKVYGKPSRVFVDKNGNNKFDEGEEELSIV